MIKVSFDDFDKTLKQVCGGVVEHLEDGSSIYGNLTNEEKEIAHKEAKENIDYLINQITNNVDKNIIKNIYKE